jgi:hypothetical protein
VALRERHRGGRADEAADAERDRGQARLQRREVLAGLQPQRKGQEEALQAGRERELFPTMTSLAGEFALSDPGERFEILLDIFVDGLARRAATEAPR